MMLQHCHKQSGFSLLDLMIAMAILGIVATVSAPSFSGMVEKLPAQKCVE